MILIRGGLMGLGIFFISGAFANQWEAAADTKRSSFFPILGAFIESLIGGVLLSAAIWI